MAKDRQVKSHRNPNLLSHYHGCSTRVFYNGGRANEYLHNLFLKAAKNGEEQRIRNFLARSSKNCNVNLNYKDKDTGNTAVVLAASRNHVKIVKMLLNYGADITLLNYEGQSIFDLVPDSIIPMLLASVERQGVSNRHLLQAAWQGNLQILRKLLSSQADLDVNCKNADGMTPLLLVTRDVNLFEKIEKNVAEKGYSPLEVVKKLLQHKADCSVTSHDGRSPLHYISRNKGPNAENMANLIIEDANSHLELLDKSDSLPIHLASRHDNWPVLLALINGGANVNARGHLGQTPLHMAAAHGHERCSSVLLNNGADVTIVDEYGNSPIDLSKSRKVKMVLKEAWVEQTSGNTSRQKRSYSAPTELLTEKEKELTENIPDLSVLSPRNKKQTSPRKISAESSSILLDVNSSNKSQVPHPPKTRPKHVKRSHSVTKVAGYNKPTSPKTSSNNRTKYSTQTRQISSFSPNAGMTSSRQVLELPKLSIKNIELQLASSFHTDVALQQPYYRCANIQRFRLLNNPSSLPLTPNTYHHGSTSRMSDNSSPKNTERTKLPKTLAPLPSEGRMSSADTRQLQVSSRASVFSGHELVGDFLDLDNLQSTSSCHPSLAKIVFYPEDKDMIQPPPSSCEENGLEELPSPCGDNGLEELPSPCGDNGLEELPSPCGDNGLEELPSPCGDNGLEELPSPCGDNGLEELPSPCGDSEDKNGERNRYIEMEKDKKNEELIGVEAKNGSKKDEHKLMDNEEMYSTTKEHLYKDNDDDFYKTQTFSSSKLPGFWIPCSKNGETSPGNTASKEKSKNEQNYPNLEKITKEKESINITKEMENEKDGNTEVDEKGKIEKRKDSSVSFFVDLDGIKTPNSTKCCLCGKSLDNEKTKRCKECANNVLKKTFWISLDGETSDGETDGVSGTKKIVQRKVSTSETQRYTRRAQSLPDNKLPIEAKLENRLLNSNNLNAEFDEKVLREKYLAVHSGDTFVIQATRCKESRDEDTVVNDGKGMESFDLLHSEDTFIIEKNTQEDREDSERTNEQNRSKSECNKELTGNQVDGKNGGKTDERIEDDVRDKKSSNEEKEIDNTFKSSIVLQSLSMDDYDDTNQHNAEEKISARSSSSPPSSTEFPPSPTAMNPVGRFTDVPVHLKTAWSNDGGQPLGVQISNAYPSPVPPINIKPEVQPPIGSCCGKTKPRKPNSGKVRKKASAKESKKKDDKRCTRKEQTFEKRGKKSKKGKGKKIKPMFKEISVNQFFGAAGFDSLTSGVSCDLKEGLPSPDLDNAPTLSIDARSTTKLLKGKFPTLSPIPESPRSLVLTPRIRENGDGSSESAAVETLRPEESSTEREELGKPEKNRKETVEEVVVARDGDDGVDCGVIKNTDQDASIKFADDGVDEVDGGVFSLFKMCIPRLKFLSSDSEGNTIENDNGEDDDDDYDNDDDNDDDEDDDDHGIVNKTYQYEHLGFPVDEADQDMEETMQNILENNDTGQDAEKASDEDLLCKHSSLEQDTTKSSNDSEIVPSESGGDVLVNSSHQLDKESDEKKELKEKWTMNYVSQMFGTLEPCDFDTPDDVFIQHGDEGKACTSLDEEMKSDDSSYISCDSTSRAVSDCSSTESNDSYFSSREYSSQEMTRSSQDGSVDIYAHERMHKSQKSASSSRTSESNDCRSTLRARSNRNSSEISVQSFLPFNSRGFVRSQVGSESGSLSSTTSCGEEIQWQKGNILGKGGFGTVWLGLVNTGEMIAVKQVELNNKDESEAEKQYEKLQEEVSLLKSLRHQNIVKYIGTCLEDNCIVNIFMEYVPGGSIALALKRFGAFVEPVFQRYTKQILSGVDYLHQKNVIHRDIKGGNIMLTPSGVIKLIDFGCAKRLCMSLSLSRSNIMHSMKGTPYWMAPEVVKETSGQGTKSDIWSIGCTVYEMATGSPPWSHMTPMAAIFAIGNGSSVPQLSSSFSTSARDFVAACMTREPSKRPSASDLLQHEFITTLI